MLTEARAADRTTGKRKASAACWWPRHNDKQVSPRAVTLSWPGRKVAGEMPGARPDPIHATSRQRRLCVSRSSGRPAGNVQRGGVRVSHRLSSIFVAYCISHKTLNCGRKTPMTRAAQRRGKLTLARRRRRRPRTFYRQYSASFTGVYCHIQSPAALQTHQLEQDQLARCYPEIRIVTINATYDVHWTTRKRMSRKCSLHGQLSQ